MKRRNWEARLRTTTALTPLVLLALTVAGPAYANPEGGKVAAGSATIAKPDPKTVEVDQQSQRAIIEWRQFDIEADETTRFKQPNVDAWALNRVVGSQDPSRILGTLEANGNIVLVNPDGVHFGPGSRVDVNRLIATTADIEDDNFMTGNMVFDVPGDPSASIVNEGTITARDYGLATLVAPSVRNSGVITARLGQVSLASGNQFTIDPYGDGLVKLAVDDEITSDIYDVATGERVTDLVKNEGTLNADGGTVAMTAATARQAVNSVVNNTGVVEARSVAERGGKIILGGQTAGTKVASAATQTVRVSGTLDATSYPVPTRVTVPTPAPRGHLEITGETILAYNADIDASGANGGGTILIGGDYLGGNATDERLAELGVEEEDHIIPTASFVALDESVTINADATQNGDGGKVIVWSDEATVTAAEITARGGVEGGDGGFIETSGKFLDVRRAADASAANGKAGTWLLDPLNVTISDDPTSDIFDYYGFLGSSRSTGADYYGVGAVPVAANSNIDTDDIETALNTGTHVSIDTGTTGAEEGNIYLTDDIRKTSGGKARLFLHAHNDIFVSPNVELSSISDELGVEMFANNGMIYGYNVGQIDLNGGYIHLEALEGISFHSPYSILNNEISIGVNYSNYNPSDRVEIDIEIGDDIINFWHNGQTAYFEPGAFQFVDPNSSGEFYAWLFNLDWALSDNAMRINDGRQWGVWIDPDHAIGTVQSDALNGTPEIISEGFVLAGQTNVQSTGLVPVWEIDTQNADNCFALTCLPTGPLGPALIEAYVSFSTPEGPDQAISDPDARIELDDFFGPEYSFVDFSKILENIDPSSDMQIERKGSDDPDTSVIENGKLTINVNGETREVISYSNGVRDGYSSAPNQCVDLIKQYAVQLGIENSTNFQLGNGNQVAKSFANRSDAFEYVDGGSGVSTSHLPIDGAVLSLSSRDGNPYGHTGIVTNAEFVDEDTYVVTLFDQNWPSEDWKTVTFVKDESGAWQGSMPNTKAPGGFEAVEGWANSIDGSV